MATMWFLKDGDTPEETKGRECPWPECVAKYGFKQSTTRPAVPYPIGHSGSALCERISLTTGVRHTCSRD
jgi:hypothetical protein